MTTLTRVDTIEPISRAEAGALAAEEHRRVADLLRSLDGDDWTQATDCPLWDVRAMAGHSVAMMGDFTSLRAVMRRMRAASSEAKRTGQPMIDAMTSLQVAEMASLSTEELIARADEVGPAAARWRSKAPALLRRMPMKESVGGVEESWRMGYLFDTILTRDPWMHRIDIARAIDRDPGHTPEHDGRIVADVVAEWARRHGQPFSLVLDGPAGGHFVSGDEPTETIEMEAVEMCRILSGRAHGEGLLAQEVPF